MTEEIQTNSVKDSHIQTAANQLYEDVANSTLHIKLDNGAKLFSLKEVMSLVENTSAAKKLLASIIKHSYLKDKNALLKQAVKDLKAKPALVALICLVASAQDKKSNRFFPQIIQKIRDHKTQDRVAHLSEYAVSLFNKLEHGIPTKIWHQFITLKNNQLFLLKHRLHHLLTHISIGRTPGFA